MKSNLLFFTLLLSVLGAFAQGNNGLVAHWNFNGNANDVSGHNLNGVVNSAMLAAGYNGIANTAYNFNGSSSFINVPYNSLLNIDTGSICMLLKVSSYYTGTCQQNTVLFRGEYLTPGTSQDSYAIEFGDNYYDLDCNTYSLNHEVFDPSYHTTNPGSGGLGMWYNNSDTIKINTWYCITTTFKNDSLKLYIDGTLRITAYMQDNYAPGTDSLVIGYYAAGAGAGYPYWFNGVIDDIRLYNRPLSAAEVVQYCDTAKMLPTNEVAQIPNSLPEIIIAPNPARNNINIFLPDNTETSNIQLTNNFGQMIMEIIPKNHTVNLDISMLPAGLYFLRAKCNGQAVFKKILKY